jgi:DNA (cytosine-5)-methyltransferase 1
VLTVGSLFTGCMGLDLGLEATGAFRVVWACESDKACRRIIARHRPELDVVDDVRTLDFVDLVDVLVGGFPCQDVSDAGPRVGLDGEQSSLWRTMAATVRLLRPRLVLVENVPGLATRGFGRVLYDLAAERYVGRWLRLRSSDVGAPHRRERLFVLARDASPDARRVARPPTDERDSRPAPGSEPQARRRPGPTLDRAARSSGDLADWGPYAPAIGRWELELGRPVPRPIDDRGRLEPGFVEWLLGFPDEWTAGEPRTSRLRMLGNSVQVQVAELAGRLLLDELEATA